jgi:tetratricopeptide (TPR) repeat protein
VYARGGWTLPSVLSASDLPLSDAAAVQARIANLPAYARCMLWAHALAPRAAFRRVDYAIVIGLEESTVQRELDRAVIELLCERFLRYDGRRYGIAHPAAANLALAAAPSGEPEALRRVQRGLAAYCRRISGTALLVAKHLFAAGDDELGLAEVMAVLSRTETSEQLVAAAQSRPSEAAAVLAHALEVARDRHRPEREIMCLEQWLLMLSPVVDSAYYARVGPSLRARLERDSGYAVHQRLPATGERLAQALAQASEAHARRSPSEQGLAPEQAIAWVARYVAVSIAVGSKTHDGRLLASLPGLIEPFAALSPLIDALWQNALAVCESSLHCKHTQACARWRGVLERLPNTSSADLHYVEYVRRAVMFALGMLEVRLGFGAVDDWAQQLDADPAQAVNAMYLRKCLRLQAGDREGAEQCRKQAELLHLRSTAEQMFTSNLLLELSAHALARDVQGVKQCWDRIVPLAARYPGWVVAENLARGLFHQSIGEPLQALQAYEASLSQIDLVRDAGAKVVLSWPAACAGYVETLNELGRFSEARAYAERVLQICSERDIDVGVHAVVRALALAEAKSGESAAACASARLERLLDEQRRLGIKGIQLAATYEARAKVALSMQDGRGYREYARLGAAEYHEAHTSSLSTRYTGWWTKAPDGSSCASDACFDTVQLRGASSARGAGVLERELLAASAPEERAQRALALLCDARAVPAGRLYLRTELIAEHGQATFAEDLGEHVRALVSGAGPTLNTLKHTHSSALGPFERDTEQAWLLRASHAGQAGQAGEESVLGVVVFPHAVAGPELVRITRALKIVSSALQRVAHGQ